jgi:hypothetical protein
VFLFSSLAAIAQPVVGPEVVSGPLAASNATFSIPRTAVVMARDRAGVAIAWSMLTSDGVERVHVTRLDNSAHAIGATRVIPSMIDASFPSIAAAPDGNGFVLAWLERGRFQASPSASLMFCRLDVALQPSEPRLLIKLNTPARPVVRSGAVTCIAAGVFLWRLEPDGSVSGYTLGFTTSDMVVGDSLQLISGERVTGPDYTCADQCRVHGGPFNGSCSDGPGCRIYPQGYRLLVTSSSWLTYSFGFESDSLPAIESNGRDTLFAWLRGDQSRGGDVVAAHLTTSDETWYAMHSPRVLGTFSADASPSAVDIATDGDRYLTVWRTKLAAGDHDIVAASLDREGRVTPLSIASTPADESDPSVIALGNGTFLIAYEKIDGADRRIAGRIVSFGARRRTAE